MIAATAPANLLGTAFGPYNLLCGNLLLVTSVVAGLLGGWFGPSTTFWIRAGIAMMTLMSLNFCQWATETDAETSSDAFPIWKADAIYLRKTG